MVNTQNESRLRKLEELKSKALEYQRLCATLSSTLKLRGIDISSLANMGLSSAEMQMISNYFIFKNEQVNLNNTISILTYQENDSQSRNRELNQLEADKQIQERKKQEENYREQKQAEDKVAADKSYYNSNFGIDFSNSSKQCEDDLEM